MKQLLTQNSELRIQNSEFRTQTGLVVAICFQLIGIPIETTGNGQSGT